MSACTTGLALLLCAGALGAAVQGPFPAPARKEAERLSQKVVSIRAHAQQTDSARRVLRTVLTESEVNAYLFWDPDDALPAGITEPRLELAGEGRVSARAVVDLTAIRTQRERGWLDPLAYVGGRVPVTASGVIRARDGLATLDLTGATVAGVSVPKSVLQELVSYYTRSPQFPEGVDLDAPFPLPASIREVRVGKGEATVIQ